MNNYPAGAEHRSDAPYNEKSIDPNTCYECHKEIDDNKEYCLGCEIYNNVENAKTEIMKIVQMSETLENVYARNTLLKSIQHLNKINTEMI